MSYDHKDEVQADTRAILERTHEEIGPGLWRRKNLNKDERSKEMEDRLMRHVNKGSDPEPGCYYIAMLFAIFFLSSLGFFIWMMVKA